ncbi:MAG: polysaccharide deacetylase [Lachnospiraceae bacterium]|nr:polysaccharide deacetylase [Lachnospiraceae bacterium]
MLENNYQYSDKRRRRVQRLKKIIILFLMLAILIPIVGCIILFGQVHKLNQSLDEMSLQIEDLLLKSNEQEQKEWIKESAEAVICKGQTGTVTGNDGIVEDKELSQTQESIDPYEGMHKVYLTFDDGPSRHTNEILDILEEYDVKATFFVVGKEEAASKEAMAQIVEKGHTIGLHSYSHDYSVIYRSVEDFAADFVRLQEYVYQVTGQKSYVYRFPGGSSNTVSEIDMQEFAAYLESQGVTYYDWNISSGDGGSHLVDVNTLVENCMKGITSRDTSIILLHDVADKDTTVEALPIIIERIQAMENTVILPITELTVPIQHIKVNEDE